MAMTHILLHFLCKIKLLDARMRFSCDFRINDDHLNKNYQEKETCFLPT